MKKRILALCLALCTVFSLLSVAASAAGGAKLETIQALGIMKGDEKGDLMLENPVTRAQFVTMMTRVSVFKDSVSPDGSGYSLFDDVKANHWASAYIDLAVSQGWIVGYTDGTFRPEKSISLEEACTMALRLLGYDASTLTGAFPAAQLNKAAALGLRDEITLAKGETMTRRDCVTLFYNLLTAKNTAGQIHAATLGYPLKNGEVDYAAVVTDNLEGPFIAAQQQTLPFTPVTVYRNGEIAASAALSEHDVYYYNEGMATLWIYTDRTAGKVTALTPSATAPASVTVAGKVYQIATSAAAYALSTSGGGATGNFVTLLLGMDDQVVGVLDGNSAQTVYYGIVQNSSDSLSDGDSASVDTTVRVVCTDGVVRSFAVPKATFRSGQLVRVSISGGAVNMEGLVAASIIGRVDRGGEKLDSYRFAKDVQILDTAKAVGVKVKPEELAGHMLDGGDVRYYVLNEAGELSHLILNNVTGNAWSYGYVTADTPVLTVVQNGKPLLHNSKKQYPVKVGGVGILYDETGAVQSMQQLSPVHLSSLTAQAATVGSKTYALADNVQIYLNRDGDLYLTELSAVNTLEHKFTGWYDPSVTGSKLRIIIATAR